MSFDYTSAFGPGKRGTYTRTVAGAVYNKELITLHKQMEERRQKLINVYGEFLSAAQITNANMQFMDKKSVGDYERAFFINVLFDYRIWNVDEDWLGKLQTTIAENDNAWLKSFLDDKAAKEKRCKRV